MSTPASADPATTGETPPPHLQRGRLSRAFWLVLGLILVGIGFIGIFVPLLPTTDFLLLALPCFAKSSPRLEAWLINHPRFGPNLRAWRRNRAVPRRAKYMACIGMAFGYFMFWLHVRPEREWVWNWRWGWSIGIALFLIFWARWIIRRPEPTEEDHLPPSPAIPHSEGAQS